MAAKYQKWTTAWKLWKFGCNQDRAESIVALEACKMRLERSQQYTKAEGVRLAIEILQNIPVKEVDA